MKGEKYNGWSNYETWAVALWLGNERDVYEFWRDAARRHWASAQSGEQVQAAVWTRHEAARFNLSDQIRQKTITNIPELIGMYGDLLHAALSEVNWSEIADDILTEVINKADRCEVLTEVLADE